MAGDEAVLMGGVRRLFRAKRERGQRNEEKSEKRLQSDQTKGNWLKLCM